LGKPEGQAGCSGFSEAGAVRVMHLLLLLFQTSDPLHWHWLKPAPSLYIVAPVGQFLAEEGWQNTLAPRVSPAGHTGLANLGAAVCGIGAGAAETAPIAAIARVTVAMKDCILFDGSAFFGNLQGKAF